MRFLPILLLLAALPLAAQTPDLALPNNGLAQHFSGPETYHFIHHYNAPGTFLFSDDYALTWNRGSQPNGSFQTTGHHVLELDGMSHASGIEQVLTMTATHANLGDHAVVYAYSNYMPGSAVAGSDEGYAGIRLGSSPMHAMSTTLNGNPTNAPGSTVLRWDSAGYCGGSGSGFGSDSCTAPGYWLGDMDDPLYPGLHMDRFASATSTLPTAVHTVEAMRPGLFASSPKNIEPCPDLQNGCTVTLPITFLPGTKAAPASGHACLSSPNEHTAEEVTYDLAGTALTLHSQRFIHYIANGGKGDGAVTIGLQSCALAYFAQDAADNSASATTAAGPTWYVSLGALDAHTVLLSTHSVGGRDNGSIGRQSIQPDGGKLGLFGIYPGALLLDVDDPTHTPDPHVPYAYNVRYGHLAANTAPWGPGKRITQGYFPGDIYYLHRSICDAPLADLGLGRDCHYTEGRGNLANFTHYRSTQDPGTRGRRDTPNVNFFEFYSNNNQAGFYGVYDLATGTPDIGWLVAQRPGCGGHLDDPQNCPDHFLWKEGDNKWIKVSDKSNRMTFSMPITFTQPITFTTPVTFKAPPQSDSLKGPGNAYACLDPEGRLFRSNIPCR